MLLREFGLLSALLLLETVFYCLAIFVLVKLLTHSQGILLGNIEWANDPS